MAYTLAVAAVGGGYGVINAYTTSQSWSGAMPFGVIAFETAEAASLGQGRAFVLDLRRLAYLPLTVMWFPRIGNDGAGVLGRASKVLRDRVNAMATELVKRRPETLYQGSLSATLGIGVAFRARRRATRAHTQSR